MRILADTTARGVAALAAAAVLAAAPSRTFGHDHDLAELSLQELIELRVGVVTSASKHEESVARAPASVTVIGAEEIRALGHRTLADVLSGVRGFFTTHDRNYGYVAIRGLGRPGDYNTRVLLLLDGHQLNDNLYDQAMIGEEFPVDLELVDRVEIVRGPGSALYGGNAMFAVVNVITRSPGVVQRGVASVGGGSLGVRRGRMEWNTEVAGVRALASASAFDAAGADVRYPELSSSLPAGGLVRDLDWERGGRAFAKLVRGDLRFTAGAGLRDKGIPTAPWGTIPNDWRTETRDLRAFAELAWDRAVVDAVRASLRLYADEYRYVGRYPYDEGGPEAVVFRDDHVGRYVGSEARLRWTAGAHALVVGAEGRVHVKQEMRSGNEGEAPSLDVLRSPGAVGSYAQAELRPLRWLQLTFGGRYDVQPGARGQASPRVAAVLQPKPGTTLKVLQGNAFRAPNVYESFYYGTSSGGLRREVIRTTEVVAEQVAWRGARLIASAYAWELEGILSETQPEPGSYAYVNGPPVSARGVELELEQRVAYRLTGRLSWALQRAESSGAELTNSPRHLGRLHLLAPLPWRPLHGGLELHYASSRRTLGGGSTDAHLLAHLTLAAHGLAGGRVDVRASMRNALDARYADPGSTEHVQDVLPRDGRTIDVQLVARF